jgi:GNAT superfamily N-acetyltransferase
VVDNGAGTLVGFATGNRYQEGDLPYAGQLNKMYLLRHYQRLGLGRRLMSVMAQRFIDTGIHSMVLFAEAANPSIKFYDALGGQRLYDDHGKFHGAYGWSDLKVLL